MPCLHEAWAILAAGLGVSLVGSTLHRGKIGDSEANIEVGRMTEPGRWMVCEYHNVVDEAQRNSMMKSIDGMKDYSLMKEETER